jgi:hypothetical protein
MAGWKCAVLACPALAPCRRVPRGATRASYPKWRLRGLHAQFNSNFPLPRGVQFTSSTCQAPPCARASVNSSCRESAAAHFALRGSLGGRPALPKPAGFGQKPAMPAPLDARHKYIAARVGVLLEKLHYPRPCSPTRRVHENALPIARCSWQRPMPTSRQRARRWQWGERPCLMPCPLPVAQPAVHTPTNSVITWCCPTCRSSFRREVDAFLQPGGSATLTWFYQASLGC